MTDRHPLVAAAGIATLVTLAGVLGVGGILAVIGHLSVDGDSVSATGWDGEYGADAATNGPTDTRPTPDDAAAVALLDRATSAVQTVAYHGVTLTGGNGLTEPVPTRVTGIPGVGTVVQSAQGSVVLAGQGRSASLADASRVLDLLVANYRVARAADADRVVSGRSALGVVASRPDGTPAARFWFDEGAGLLLRRDLLGRGGAVVSSTWFSELAVGRQRTPHLPPYAVDAWSHVLAPADRAAWRLAGCRCAEALPDGLSLLQARTDDAGSAAGPGGGVVHLLYSDGLTELSVFEQPGTLDAAGTLELGTQGFESLTYAGVSVLRRVLPAAESGVVLPTGEWVWVCGSSVMTVVAPALPQAAAERRVERVITALTAAARSTGEAPAAEDGVLAAVRRGWHRVTHAVTESWDHLRSSSGSAQVLGVGWGHGFLDPRAILGPRA